MRIGDVVEWKPISGLAPRRGRVVRIDETGRVHVTVEYQNIRGQTATGEAYFDAHESARLMAPMLRAP